MRVGFGVAPTEDEGGAVLRIPLPIGFALWSGILEEGSISSINGLDLLGLDAEAVSLGERKDGMVTVLGCSVPFDAMLGVPI